jgi:signal transduction histidine kinase
VDFDRLAHQLRNPVMVIRTLASLVGKRLGPDDPNQALLDQIVRECRRLDALLEDQLEVRAPGAVPLEPLVAEVERAANALARERQIRFAREGQVSCRVKADGRALYEVLMNLLDNAFKYTPPGGQVRLEVRPGQNACTIDIADTGGGIEAADLERIFDAHYRGSRNGDRPGRGLGLAIARDLIEQMGGSIDARNGEGGGSRFCVTLPTAQED